MVINTHKLETLAEKLANNHARFDSFVWFERPENSENWALIYTSNRDSGIVDQSNEVVINAALKPFSEGDEPDVVLCRNSHWAVGYVDGFALRVRKDNGEITEAFRAYAELFARMENYPVLDEDDYSNREYNSALEAIQQEAPELISEHDGWLTSVFEWLYENEQTEVENSDDRGACPSRAAICRALEALKYGYVCPGCDTVIQVNTPTEGHRNICKHVYDWDRDKGFRGRYEDY